MKKFLVILVCMFISLCSYAQPKLLIYEGQTNIYASVNKQQEAVVWFTSNYTSGDAETSYLACGGVKNINLLHDEFVFLKNKLLEYDKIAEENNIDSVEKIICDIKGFTTGNWFIWNNAFQIGLCTGNKFSNNYPKAKYILSNGTSNIIIYGWYKMYTNKYVDVYSSIILNSDNIDDYINLLGDYNAIVKLINDDINKNNLFN